MSRLSCRGFSPSLLDLEDFIHLYEKQEIKLTDRTTTTTPNAVVGNWLEAAAIPILLWPFAKAPFDHLVGLGQKVVEESAEDHDWVALVPGYLRDRRMPWRENLDTGPWIWIYRESKRDLRTSFRAIKIWPWDLAPAQYRALSPHGGDEDWVALTPRGMHAVPMLHEGTPFGTRRVSKHRLPYGRAVYIGAHARKTSSD